MKKSEKTFTLLHGSPKKVEIGDFLDPKYCGMWERSTSPNPRTGKIEKCLFFIDSLKYALLYARREIYSPTVHDFEKDKPTQYFLFNRPDAVIYVYTVELPLNKLSDMHGKFLDKIDGEAICFEPVKVLDRQDYTIQRILEHYSITDKQNTTARVLNPLKKNDLYPNSFGWEGNIGTVHFHKDEIDRFLNDLQKYTKPIPGIIDCIYKKEMSGNSL